MRLLVCLALVVALGCSGAPAPVVQTQRPSPPEPLPDPRVGEMQVLLRELLDRIEVMNARMQQLEQQVDLVTRAGGREAAAAARPEPRQPPPRAATAPQTQPVAAANPAPSRPPSGQRPAGVSEAERYREALVLYAQGRLDQARERFRELLEADPRGELADNCLYWIAEIHFAFGEYREAIGIYQQIESDYPDQNKAADAMLRMGIAWTRLGDLALAKRTFEQLISRYPYSTPASAARLELDRIRY